MTELPDYREDPEAYEVEERSRPDEMAMLNRAGGVASQLLDRITDASVLDLCCGTGLSLEHLVNHPNVSYIVGVDICQPYLDFAAHRFQNARTRPFYILGDAVEAPLPRDTWDIVMLASAYHHIEDERKLQFLSRVHELLGENGYAVVAENLLPEYTEGDKESYATAVRLFYREVLKEAKLNNPTLPEYVEGLIQRVAQYGFDGDYEYKTSLPIFLRYLQAAGLETVSQERVWPHSGPLSETSGGNYVMLLRPAV